MEKAYGSGDLLIIGRWYRPVTQWARALSPILTWTARQIFLWSIPDVVPEATCLNFVMEQWVPDSLFTPLVPLRVEVKPANWHRSHKEPLPKGEKPLGQYTLMVDTEVILEAIVYFSELEGNGILGPLYAQWPWIFAHCVIMGDINPIIAQSRLEALLYTIRGPTQAASFFNQFIAPKFDDKFNFSREELDKWMQMMYPVVSSLRSRFHSPSNIISKMYGHLE